MKSEGTRRAPAGSCVGSPGRFSSSLFTFHPSPAWRPSRPRSSTTRLTADSLAAGHGGLHRALPRGAASRWRSGCRCCRCPASRAPRRRSPASCSPAIPSSGATPPRVGDLLTQVPGVFLWRGGFIGRPEPVNYQGRGATSAEYYLDGLPYVAAGVDSIAVDPALFSISLLDRIEVERWPGLLRVHLFTRRHDRARAALADRRRPGRRRLRALRRRARAALRNRASGSGSPRTT